MTNTTTTTTTTNKAFFLWHRARLRFTRLSDVTEPTDNFGNRKSIDLMMSFLSDVIIVTQRHGPTLFLFVFGLFYRVPIQDPFLLDAARDTVGGGGRSCGRSLLLGRRSKLLWPSSKRHRQDRTFVVTDPTAKGQSATGADDSAVPFVVTARRT
jgi:hypothetical protein